MFIENHIKMFDDQYEEKESLTQHFFCYISKKNKMINNTRKVRNLSPNDYTTLDDLLKNK